MAESQGTHCIRKKVKKKYFKEERTVLKKEEIKQS